MKECVIIPLYKESLTEREEESIKQTTKIFFNREIVVICPISLDLSYYDIYKPFRVERFDDKFFTNTYGYNFLMCSPLFWNRFAGYDYILICQTDVYVFHDDLDKWTSKGYDYIGAPWMFSNIDRNVGDLLHNVGNGGFSLRKVETFRNYINEDEMFFRNALLNGCYEDTLLSLYTNQHGKVVTKPSYLEAGEFSFETNPRELFEKTKKIPFGWHAYRKYDNEFFNSFIENER